MPELNDCYVLAPERSAELALRFLESFLPSREPSFAGEDPSEVLGLPPEFNLNQTLDYLEEETEKSYSMYFRNQLTEDPLHAAVMFRGDGCLFLMLSIDASRGHEVATDFLDQLKEFSHAAYGYWGSEESPAEDGASFKQRTRLAANS